MAIEASFLTSRVARRIFFLFVLCALVPIAALALISFGTVSQQLAEQARDRLDSEVHSVGQGISSRLLLLEMELATAHSRDPDDQQLAARLVEEGHFLGLAVVDVSGQVSRLAGEIGRLPELNEQQRGHVDWGRTLLIAEPRPGQLPRILLTQALDTGAGNPALLIGSVYPPYLWTGGENMLPSDIELCIFNEENVVLFCTRPADGRVPGVVRTEISRERRYQNSGSFEWQLEGETYIASYWGPPLFRYGVPEWKLMTSEARANVLAPMASFRYFFPLIIIVSLCIVLLASIRQIRRSLVPLERLQEGTRRIAAREFDSVVEVDSGDEFEELAESFNEMASRLGKQFTALSAIAEIDRAILSTLDIQKIVGAVLERTSDLVACDAVSVTLVSPDQQKVTRTFTLRAKGKVPWMETVYFSPEDYRKFDRNPEFFTIGMDQGAPGYAAALARSGCRHFCVFPMFINEEASGVVALGFAKAPQLDDEDIEQVRQVSDQVAVALSNVHLLEDLDALNWGALTALARTVDAKSPWTAGHSERVTQMGLKIAEKMELGKDEIDILHRGGLLHDIGKIGVPAAILDKPGKLTDEEWDLIKKHPEIGATILQPIAAYADIIPIVRQHHERWDGSGYPDGLAGKQIHRYARIYAVADVYDALESERPYRAAMPIAKVMGIIVGGNGTEFDPEVIDAFIEVMRDEGNEVPEDRLLASG